MPGPRPCRLPRLTADQRAALIEYLEAREQTHTRTIARLKDETPPPRRPAEAAQLSHWESCRAECRQIVATLRQQG